MDRMKYKVGEFVLSVRAFHLLAVFPDPCGTKSVHDFQPTGKQAAKTGETGNITFTGGRWYGNQDGIGSLFLEKGHTCDVKRENFGDEGSLLPFLETENQIAGHAVFYGYVLAACGIIVVDVEAKGAVYAHFPLKQVL